MNYPFTLSLICGVLGSIVVLTYRYKRYKWAIVSGVCLGINLGLLFAIVVEAFLNNRVNGY